MKILSILFFIFFLHVDAQRRSQTRQEVTKNEQPIRSRGRSRFSNPEYIQLPDETNRRSPSRRRPDPTIAPVEKQNYPSPINPSSTASYAVEEVVEEHGPLQKPKVLTESNFEAQNIPLRENEFESEPKQINEEPSSNIENENPLQEEGIPGVRIENYTGTSSRENLDQELPKLSDKVVPITRNNVRNGGGRTGSERKTDNKNGQRAGSDRASRNGLSGTSNEDTPSSPRKGASRFRAEKNLPSRNSFARASSSEELSPSLSSLTGRDPIKDENEIRKEIVRNSMQMLPQPIGIPTELNKPVVPKKTIKKTIRTRVNTNTRTEEVSSAHRSRITESYEPPSNSRVEQPAPVFRPGVQRPRVVEEYAPMSRGRTAGSPRELESPQPAPVLRQTTSPRVVEEYVPVSRGRAAGSPRDIEYTPSQRTRTPNAPKPEEPSFTVRSRTRGSRKPVENTSTVSSRSNHRGIRRRPDPSSTTTASIPRRNTPVQSDTEASYSGRSRTGRKIEHVDGRNTRVDANNNIRSTSSRSGSVEQLEKSQNGGRRQNFRPRTEDISDSKNRFNGRPPIDFDESKLEVLPLFEGETKLISEPGTRSNQLQFMVSTATESENKVLSPPENTSPRLSTHSDISSSKKESSTSNFKRKPYKKTEIRESVISKVTEVTSRRSITRKPILKPGTRKFADIKSNSLKAKSSNGLSSSEEDISESDNYPEPFKALIQSKKHEKESRSPSSSHDSSIIAKNTEKIVSSSEAVKVGNLPSRASTPSIKYEEDLENELKPKVQPAPTSSSGRKRLNPSLEQLKTKKTATSTRKPVSRSTLAPAKEPKEHKFHSKFKSATKNDTISNSKPFKAVSPLGLPKRKTKLSEKNTYNKTKNTLEIGNSRAQFTVSPIQKSSRYSSKYRSNGQSRTVSRSSTAPPAYIPTIPSLRQYSTTSVKPRVDPELGLEYITFDAPVRSISSANLINGEYRPSDANSNSLDSKQTTEVKTTEKPTSIIERIINSITGINLTTDPTNISSTTTSTAEPSESSAILSLAPKKAKKSDDLTQQKIKSNKRDAATSEKPTTVIQRILNSLSAIQAGTTTETTTTITTNTPNLAVKQQTTEVISLELLLMQRNTVKPWEKFEENKIPEVDNKVEDNIIVDVRTTAAPSTRSVTTIPQNIITTTATPSFLNTILSTLQSIATPGQGKTPASTTLTPLRFSSTYRAPYSTIFTTTTPVIVRTTTTVPTTTTMRTTTTSRTTTTPLPTTIRVPVTTTPQSTITVPPTTTRLTTTELYTPSLFTSKEIELPRSGKNIKTSTVFPYYTPSEFPLFSLFSTERARRTNAAETSTSKKTTTTTPKTTTVRTKKTTLRNTETTDDIQALLKQPIDSIKPKKQLTEQQKKDLEIVRQLEKEQAAILKQLSFLTNLNLNANSFNKAPSSDNLAQRIVALAKERDSRKVKSTTTTTPVPTTKTTTPPTKPTARTNSSKIKSKSDDDGEKERIRQIESLIKLLNMNGVTPSPNKESTYGTSNDAILAALLKERGIGPSTPKQLAEQIEQFGIFTQTNEITTKPTKKRKPTTQPTQGPILQRLTRLFNILAPPPTKAPVRKPKATTTKKPKPKVIEQDMLTNEPTHVTVVTAPPTRDMKNSVSQEDIQRLIRQLEAIQKDPSAAKNLDLSSFKSLQNLNRDNVQVYMPGSSGISEREITKPVTRTVTQRSKSTTTAEYSELAIPLATPRATARTTRTTTFSPTPVSNDIFEDVEEVTTKRGRVALPPVKLRPVSGVSDDAGSLVRGRLLSAAVNVTRAISGFLGSALQEAVRSLSTALGSGSVRNFVASSSAFPTGQATSHVAQREIDFQEYS